MKNLFSFLMYGVKLKSINILLLIINLGILVYTIFDIRANASVIFSNKLHIIIIFLFVNVIWQIISMFADIVRFVRHSGHWLTARDENPKIILSDEIKKDYVLLEQEDAPVIINEKINTLLLSENPISLHLHPSHTKRVWSYIMQHRDTLQLFLKAKWSNLKNGSFFNESKLCQASEIIISSNGHATVKVSKGSYYNSFLTNDIYNLVLKHQDGINIYPPMSRATTPITSFENSYFGNHFGVTTLVVTSDGYVMLLRHNDKTAVSADKYAGSASGSVDFSDWKKKRDADLRQVLVRAAHRELLEEAGLKDLLKKGGHKLQSRVIGMYRHLERGGKPDYCLVTGIDADHLDVVGAFKAEKKEVVNKIKFIRIIDESYSVNTGEFDKFMQEQKSAISVPLFMNYYFLKQNQDLVRSLFQTP